MKIVADSSPLIGFAILGQFDEARNKFKDNAEAFRELRDLGYNAAKYGITFVTTSRRSIRHIEVQSTASSTLDSIFGKEYLAMYKTRIEALLRRFRTTGNKNGGTRLRAGASNHKIR